MSLETRVSLPSFRNRPPKNFEEPEPGHFLGPFDRGSETVDVECVSEVDMGPTLSDPKQRLNLNIELASPDRLIPPLPNWEARSEFITREHTVSSFTSTSTHRC